MKPQLFFKDIVLNVITKRNIYSIFSKYTRSLRTEKCEALKRGSKSQQSTLTKLNTEQEAITHASVCVTLEITKRGKPFPMEKSSKNV